jgi:hypothetical protein
MAFCDHFVKGRTMKVLTMDTILPGGNLEKIHHCIREESAAAWTHYTDGIVREIYFRLDRPGAVMVRECGLVKQARKMTDRLRLVREGLIRFELIPPGPVLLFAELFEHKETRGQA